MAYFDHVVDVLDLADDIDLRTTVTSARFDESNHRWTVTADGRRYDCQYLLLCTGFGSKAYIPDLPGLDSFTGVCHHTAHWPAGLYLPATDESA